MLVQNFFAIYIIAHVCEDNVSLWMIENTQNTNVLFLIYQLYSCSTLYDEENEVVRPFEVWP